VARIRLVERAQFCIRGNAIFVMRMSMIGVTGTEHGIASTHAYAQRGRELIGENRRRSLAGRATLELKPIQKLMRFICSYNYILSNESVDSCWWRLDVLETRSVEKRNMIKLP
jgi:hypothetical protein